MTTLFTENTNNTSAQNLVFIDSGVEDYQYLLQGVVPNTQAYIINSDSDGIEQISRILGQYQNVQTVHIISHGSPGCLYLGNSQLSLDNLNSYASQLQQWNIKNLLLYGCYVATGDAGTEFIEKLHNLTGAEIAASQSLTGSAIKGGNWQLEYQTAEAKYSLALLKTTVNNYAGVLAVSMVKDINPGFGSESSIGKLTNVNGTLYFRADDTNYGNGTYGAELWKSDGTANGTVLVKDIDTRRGPYLNNSDYPYGSYPRGLTNLNGTLYFTADDGTHGNELWKSDGTTDGTVLVKDMTPGSGGSYPINVTNVNDTLYFIIQCCERNKLWKSDGTANGTVLVKNSINGRFSSEFYEGNQYLTNVNGTPYFVNYDNNHGWELWKSDGTANGTVLVKDINPGSNGSTPANLTNVNGTLYFIAGEATHGQELWKSDGTANGTVLVKDINPGGASSNYFAYYNLTDVNGTLYFTADDGIHGSELWKSDGTANGTVLVKDINPGDYDSSPAILTNVNGTLYFVAHDGIHGWELWKSDGTADGTILVKDIAPGSGTSSPTNLTNVNGTLYFTADDGIHGEELWKSDGTANGTVLVKDIFPGDYNSSSPEDLTHVNGTLYFKAIDAKYGYSLWKLDLGAGNTATTGPDKLIGTAGADTIDGLAGNDTISGLGGNDRLLGSAGDDSINGGAGDDTMIGGTGNDIYIVNSAKDRVTEALNAGTDRIFSTASYTLPANVEHLTLQGTRAINGNGNTLNNRITGNTAANRINGGTGNDTLIGGGGNDTLIGGGGNDVLTGGAGADKFTYNTNAKFTKASVGLDTITDFVIAQGDKIVLDKTTFPKITSTRGTGFSINSEFAKVTTNTAAATSAADIVYNSATGGLFYNQNGKAAGFGTGGQFLTLTNKPVLTENQFIIQA